jgi:hypothetical protein
MSNEEMNPQDQWNPGTELPPNDVQVLAELKPSRKNAKRKIYAVVEYMRTRKGVHDAEPMWFEPMGENEVEVVRWRYIDEPQAAVPTPAPVDPDDPRPHQSDEELGWQYRILLKSHRAGCYVNFATGDIWRSDDKDIPKVLTPEEFATLTLNSDRYKKLRGWMSSNVPEGWNKVQNLAAVAAYMSWETMDQELDALPECNIGLCSPPAVSAALAPDAGS